MFISAGAHPGLIHVLFGPASGLLRETSEESAKPSRSGPEAEACQTIKKQGYFPKSRLFNQAIFFKKKQKKYISRRLRLHSVKWYPGKRIFAES
jgi:hypothetical protein